MPSKPRITPPKKPSKAELKQVLSALDEQAAFLRWQLASVDNEPPAEPLTDPTAPNTASASSMLPASATVDIPKVDNKDKDQNGDQGKGEDKDKDSGAESKDQGDSEAKTHLNFNLAWTRDKKGSIEKILGLTPKEKGIFWRQSRKEIEGVLDMGRSISFQKPGTIPEAVKKLNKRWPQLRKTKDPDWLYRHLMMLILKSTSAQSRKDNGTKGPPKGKKKDQPSTSESKLQSEPKPEGKPKPKFVQPQPQSPPNSVPQSLSQPPPPPSPPVTKINPEGDSKVTGELQDDDYNNLPDGDEFFGAPPSHLSESQLRCGATIGTPLDSPPGSSATENFQPSANKPLDITKPTTRLTSATDMHASTAFDGSLPPGSPSSDAEDTSNDDSANDETEENLGAKIAELQVQMAKAAAKKKAKVEEKERERAKKVKGKEKVDAKAKKEHKVTANTDTPFNKMGTQCSASKDIPAKDAMQANEPEPSGNQDPMELNNTSTFVPPASGKRKRDDGEQYTGATPPADARSSTTDTQQPKKRRLAVGAHLPVTPGRSTTLKKNLESPIPATPLRQSNWLRSNPHLMPTTYGLPSARKPTTKSTKLGAQITLSMPPVAAIIKKANSKKK